MEMIRARSPQAAMPALLQAMYAGGDLDDDGNLTLDHPVLFTFEQPRERLIFWPWIRRNPAGELASALQPLAQAEERIPNAAGTIVKGSEHFILSTPSLLVQVRMDRASRFNMHAVASDSNPFQGAFGQLGLQLSILLELLAGAAKKNVGELTIQHQRLVLPKTVVAQLLGVEMANIVEDPYRNIKPRKIDGPLDIANILATPEETMGKSKWVRHVAGPLLLAGRAETAAEGMELAKKIKADDFKRSMIEWCEAVQQAEDFKAQQEGSAGGEEG